MEVTQRKDILILNDYFSDYKIQIWTNISYKEKLEKAAIFTETYKPNGDFIFVQDSYYLITDNKTKNLIYIDLTNGSDTN